MNNKNVPLVELYNVNINFGNGKNKVRAAKDVSFTIQKGETFGLVGESGSGKTTIGRAILGLQSITSGRVYFNDQLIRGKIPSLKRYYNSIFNKLILLKNACIRATSNVNDYLLDFLQFYNAHIANATHTAAAQFKSSDLFNSLFSAIKRNLEILNDVIGTAKKCLDVIDGIDNFIKIDEGCIRQLTDYYNRRLSYFDKLHEPLSKFFIDLNELKKARVANYKNEFEQINAIGKIIINFRKYMVEINEKTNHVIHFPILFSTFNKIDNLEIKHKIPSQFIAFIENNDGTKKQIKTNIKEFLLYVSSHYFKFLDYIKGKQIIDDLNGNKVIAKELVKLVTHKNVILEYINKFDKTIKANPMFKRLKHKKAYLLKKKMQMIFQDPSSSLNERMSVEQIIGEGLTNFKDTYRSPTNVKAYLDYHNKNLPREQWLEEKEIDDITLRRFTIVRQLNSVGLLTEHLSRYQHEFSGGQRQRIGIARSLVIKPEFIVADEPISALDVSIRAQVLNLLKEFQSLYSLTYLFIAHDLTVVRYIADRIAVIYRGRIVELASSDELFKHPLHPYTRSLLSAIPIPNPKYEKNKKLIVYNPEVEHEDYLVDNPSWVEITKDHFVYANRRETEQYKKQLKVKK